MTLLAYPLPTLPFTDPVLIVATATVVFLVVPLLFERIRIPGIIGLIVVGAAIGPNGLGLLMRDQTIVLLGTVGLLYLMLMVGLELDLHEFNRYRHRSVVFGTLSFLVPGLIGTALALFLGYRLPSALLVGSAFSSHTLLAYPIASRLGIVRNEAVTVTLGGTILTEVLALLLLAVVASSAGGALDLAFWIGLAVPLALYIGLVLWGLPKLARWFFRNVSTEGATEFVFVMAALFTVSFAAHYAGVEPIIGALLAGLALNRLVPPQGPLMNRIHFVGNALFIPFFLLSVGMLVDVRALNGARAITISVALATGVVATKWLAAKITEKAFGYTPEEGWVMFGLSVPHAAGTLAIVLVGYEMRLLDQTEVNGVVLMILVTCLVGPWAVQRYGRKVALGEERRPYDASAAPRRVLIPLANPATSEALVDLALAVRGGGTDEPLLPLMVVPGGEATEAEVAEAEKVLSRAVTHAAGAEVPVLPLTRVDANIAAGIARGVAESRATVVVIGWDGRRTGSRVIFGTVLDQLLERTRQTVVVAKLGHALNTTRRVVLVLPPAIERHPGALEALKTVNTVASGIGASLLGVTVGGDPDRVAEVHAGVRPRLEAPWERVEGWADLADVLGARLGPDDLVVLVSARRRTLAWHPRLEKLPAQLGELPPASFLVVYPPEVEPAGEEETRLSDTVAPERVVALGPVSFVAAAGKLLASVFDADTARELTNVVVRNEQQFSSEIVPGVVLPHVRLKGLQRPVLVLGVSREGVVFPRAQAPARLVFLLVSPAERAEEHLRYLAEIARLLSTPGKVRELMERFAPETELDWLHVDD